MESKTKNHSWLSRFRSTAPIWLGVIFVLVGLFASTYLYWKYLSEVADDSRDQHLRANLAQNVLVDLVEATQNARFSDATFYSVAKRYTDLFPEIDLYLLDPEGKIRFWISETSGCCDENSVSLSPVKKFLSDPKFPEAPIYGDNPSERWRPKTFSAAKSDIPGAEGYVYIILQNRYRRLLSIPRLEQGHVLGTLGFILEVMAFIVLIVVLFRLLFWQMFLRISGVLGEHLPATAAREGAQQSASEGFEEAIVSLVRRAAEERKTLRDREADVKQALAHISHDIRTPLLLIHDHAERLISEYKARDEAEGRAYGENILRNVRALGELIAGLDVLEVLQKSQESIHPEPCALDELLYDLQAIYLPLSRERQIQLEASVPDNVPTALGSRSLLARALRNLIENALRHTPAHGKVTMGLTVIEPELITVEITDTGIGIPEKELPQIFEPFRQIEEPGRVNGSSGLGLSICQQIVRAHGGELKVESEVGKGTRFWFQLKVFQSEDKTQS